MTQARINNLFFPCVLGKWAQDHSRAQRRSPWLGEELGIQEPFVDQAITRIEGPTLIIGLFFWECQEQLLV